MQAIGLKTHIWNNAVKSLLLLLGFPFLMLIVCYAFALLWVGFFENPDVIYGLQRGFELLPAVLPIALIVSGLWLFFAFVAHQWMIDKLTGARKVERTDEPRLYNMVENLAIQRGRPIPSIRIIEISALNAYASGVRREHYAVTVTRGLLDELDDAELEAVLAHEMTHIINGDVRLIVIAAVFAGLVSLVGDVMMRGFGRGVGFRSSGSSGGSSSSSSSKSKGGGGGAILIIIAIVIFIIARLAALALRMAISRRREYMADAGAVELTKNPDAMIGALRKIERRSNLGAIPGQVEALFIDSDSAGFWATHPSIAERCEALVRYAGGHDPGPRPLSTLEEGFAEQQATQPPAEQIEAGAAS
ncbi:protease HtpX [Terrihabitans soli]|uniref:Protease HtpX n=1 Tax=Terrihabitans soli TaxID=708113 RepID=A0A6S6QLA9_9HYPH|nr:M48 family metallopeptidase [Terrihabitans soli]BCJ91184.1 protease HtpX [Terrihabitans soli]